MGLLDRAGARLTANPEDAEILVVNTCSFIDTAKQESVDTILEMARLKSTGRAKKLIVAGCLVERYRDEIQKNIPEVDAVVGTGELEAILEAAGLEPGRLNSAPAPTSLSPFTILTSTHAEIRSGKESQSGTHKQQSPNRSDHKQQSPNRSDHKQQNANHSANEKHEVSGHDFSRAEKTAKKNGALAPEESQPASRKEGDARELSGRFLRDAWAGASSALPTYLYDETTPRLLSTPRASAYIKIAEGCDHPCTFCVIPNLRGKFRSRRFESVVAEAEQLVARGVREITLIGQDTTCYGEDLGLRDGLATLLDTLARIPDLKWLRFLYAYPNRITGKLLETIAKHDNICKYLDLPLQHASPDVLKRMKRGAGADIFLKTLAKVRAAVPGIALRTSFIVGFPGESLRDFELLEEFIDRSEIRLARRLQLFARRRFSRLRTRRASPSSVHRSAPQASHEASTMHLPPRQEKLGRPRAHRPRRRPQRRNPAPLGGPHRVPRA